MGRTRLNFRASLLFFSLSFVYTYPLFRIILPSRFRLKTAYVATLSVCSILSGVYFVLSVAYRGHVKYNMETVSLVSHYRVKKFCRKCDNFKPERAHHCSACGHCIKKMDHHCFWINNCVNYDNQGHFIRFLFFSLVANTLVFSFVAVKSAAVFLLDHALESTEDYAILVTSGLVSLVLSIMTGCFFYTQMRLVVLNMTFIEQLKQDDMSKFEGVAPSVSPYDRGLMNNLQDALGPLYALFLIGPFGDGVEFIKTYPSNYWPGGHEHYNIEDTMVI